MISPVVFDVRRPAERAGEPGWSLHHLRGSGPPRVRLWLEHDGVSREVGEGDLDHVVEAVVRMEERLRLPHPDIETTLRSAGFHKAAQNDGDRWRIAGVEGLALGLSPSEGGMRFGMLRASNSTLGLDRFVFVRTVFPSELTPYVVQFALTSIEAARDAEQAEPLWTSEGRRLDVLRPMTGWERSVGRDDVEWRVQPIRGLTHLRMVKSTGDDLHAGVVVAGCEDFVMRAFETQQPTPWRDLLAQVGFAQFVDAPTEKWVSKANPEMKLFVWCDARTLEPLQMSLMRDDGVRETEVLYHLDGGPDHLRQAAFGVTADDVFNAVGAAVVKCAEWALRLDLDYDHAVRPQEADDSPLP